jgi:hypothetical protein
VTLPADASMTARSPVRHSAYKKTQAETELSALLQSAARDDPTALLAVSSHLLPHPEEQTGTLAVLIGKPSREPVI